MSFLAPLFAVGLAALAIPILVHLVHKERKETTLFPSLMFLLRTPYQHSRRQRIRDWLLFATRVMVFILLVAAFARPVFDRPPDAVAAAFSNSSPSAIMVLKSPDILPVAPSFDCAFGMIDLVRYLAILLPDTWMKTWRSACMQATFFTLLASLHSPGSVLGCVSPRALVCTRSAAIPWPTR